MGWAVLVLLAGGALPSAAQEADLRLVVVGADDETPVADALVRLEGERTRLTDDRGRVFWEDLPSGSYVLSVRHAAYEALERRIDHPPATAGPLRVALEARAFPLEEIEVEGRRPLGSVMERFEARRRLGRGDFILPEVFEERESWELSQVIARHSSLRRDCSNVHCYLLSRRAAPSLIDRPCRVQYFVDGVHLRMPPSEPLFFLDRFLSTQEVWMVEVYSGASQVPTEFNRFDARCGVVVIWTRRGPRQSPS